jgi:hypothetical protein
VAPGQTTINQFFCTTANVDQTNSNNA